MSRQLLCTLIAMPQRRDDGDYDCVLRIEEPVSAAEVLSALSWTLTHCTFEVPRTLGQARRLTLSPAQPWNRVLILTLEPQGVELLLDWMKRSHLKLFYTSGQLDPTTNAFTLELEHL